MYFNIVSPLPVYVSPTTTVPPCQENMCGAPPPTVGQNQGAQYLN